MLSSVFLFTLFISDTCCSRVHGRSLGEVDPSYLDTLSGNSTMPRVCLRSSLDKITEAPWSYIREESKNLLSAVEGIRNYIVQYAELLCSVCRHQNGIKINYTVLRNARGRIVSRHPCVVPCGGPHPCANFERENMTFHVVIEEEIKSRFDDLRTTMTEYYGSVYKLLESKGAPEIVPSDPEYRSCPVGLINENITVVDFYGMMKLNLDPWIECTRVVRRLQKCQRTKEIDTKEMIKVVSYMHNIVHSLMSSANCLRKLLSTVESFFAQLANTYEREYNAIRWDTYDPNTEESMKAALWNSVYKNGSRQYDEISRTYTLALAIKKGLARL